MQLHLQSFLRLLLRPELLKLRFTFIEQRLFRRKYGGHEFRDPRVLERRPIIYNCLFQLSGVAPPNTLLSVKVT